LFETFLTVLDEFGVYPAVVGRELERYLPFLTTTKVLMAAVKNGVGRETAHEAIKQHALEVALALRAGSGENDLFERLGADDRLGLSAAQIEQVVGEPLSFTGAAVAQVNEVVRRVGELAKRHPDAASYTAGEIL
jgi:adenylosuccinate lyase